MRQTSTLLLLSLVALFSFASCSDDGKSSALDVNFTLSYDDEPLVAFEEKNHPLDYTVFFTKYSLYISDITLTSSESSVRLADVLFTDLLEDAVDINAASAGKSLQIDDVPQGTYTGISFKLGVPADVNGTSPADYDPLTPLGNASEYWAGWESYVFHKIEGQIDEDGDGETDTSVALHMGSDDALRTINIQLPIDISEDQETIQINFDLLDILSINNSFFDFRETKQIHSLEVLPRTFPLLDNTRDKVSASQL